MACRSLTRLVLVGVLAVAAPPGGGGDATKPDPILDDHFEERPELRPVDDDGGPYIIVTGHPTSIPVRKKILRPAPST